MYDNITIITVLLLHIAERLSHRIAQFTSSLRCFKKELLFLPRVKEKHAIVSNCLDTQQAPIYSKSGLYLSLH